MRAFLAPAILAMALAWAGSSAAQPAKMQSQEFEEAPYETVTVYAPYVVKRQIVNSMMSKKSATGLEMVSVTRRVSFSDLDLADAGQAKQLESRVDIAAHDACREIEKKFPKSQYRPVPEDQNCAGNAKSAAMIAVRALEAAAILKH
jgi:UrcA family protein